MIARGLAAAAALVLLGGAAVAEPPKGPVHITSDGASHDDDLALADPAEARAVAREELADARRDLADAEQALKDTMRDLAAMEAGDFSRTVDIEDGKVVKCGDPARYPGCTPYTAAEKADMVAEGREDVHDAEADLAEARRDLAAAESAAATLGVH